MANILAIGSGIMVIIIGAVMLLVGTQVFASLDGNFSCYTATMNNSESGQATCLSVKSLGWLIIGLAPYGLVFTGIFLIFGSILGVGRLG